MLGVRYHRQLARSIYVWGVFTPNDFGMLIIGLALNILILNSHVAMVAFWRVTPLTLPPSGSAARPATTLTISARFSSPGSSDQAVRNSNPGEAPPMLARFARQFQRTNELNGRTFDRELSPLGLERGVVINKDRSLGLGFRLDAPYTPALSDEAITGIYAGLGGFLNALPEHFDLQVIWTQHSRVSEFAERMAGLELSPGLVGEVQREQQDNLLGLLKEGHRGGLRFALSSCESFPATRPHSGARRRSHRELRMQWVRTFFTDAREKFQYDLEDFAAASAELLTHARTLAGVLDNLGWSPVALDNDAVTRLFFQRWNPQQFEAGADPRKYQANDGVPFTERFVQSDFRWDPAGSSIPSGMAELDGWYHAILTLYEPPEELARPDVRRPDASVRAFSRRTGGKRRARRPNQANEAPGDSAQATPIRSRHCSGSRRAGRDGAARPRA